MRRALKRKKKRVEHTFFFFSTHAGHVYSICSIHFAVDPALDGHPTNELVSSLTHARHSCNIGRVFSARLVDHLHGHRVDNRFFSPRDNIKGGFMD